jgi:hypothetical protein
LIVDPTCQGDFRQIDQTKIFTKNARVSSGLRQKMIK